MPPPLPVFARRASDRIVFNDAPAPLSITLLGLRSTDGFDVIAYLRVVVRGVDRPADVRMFTEQFLSGREAVALDDITRHFAAALTPIAGDFTGGQSAGNVLSRRADLEQRMQARVDAIAFGCGLERSLPLSLTLDCPTLRQDQDRQAARQRQAADAERAAAMAGTLSPMTQTNADVRLTDRLAAMPPASVAVAAGPNVVLLDGDGTVQVTGLSADVGPLRSVRPLDRGRLLVGGTAGVALLSADGRPGRVLVGGDTSGRGYNAVAWERRAADGTPSDDRSVAGRIAATHGEIGLTVWRDGDLPRVLATPGPARHLVAVGGTFVLAAGEAVFALGPEDELRPIDEGSAGVVGILVIEDHLVVVRKDGSLRGIDPRTLRPTGLAHTGYAVTATAALHTPGLAAVLLADDRGNIDAVTPDARPLGRLAARVGGVRMLAAAGGRVFAVTTDRTSVIRIDPAGVERPRTTNVVARTGHHVTDMAAVPVPFSGTPREG